MEKVARIGFVVALVLEMAVFAGTNSDVAAAPHFLAQVFRDNKDTPNDTTDDTFDVKIFSTVPLTDPDVEDVVTLVATPEGTATFNDTLAMSLSDIQITGVVTPTAACTSFAITITGHSATGAEGTKEFTFYTGVDRMNTSTIPITGGSGAMGDGNATQGSFGAGAYQDDPANADGMTTFTMIDYGTSTVGAAGAFAMAAAAYPPVRRGSLPDYPDDAVSNMYGLEISEDDALTTGQTVTIGLEYDNSSYEDSGCVSSDLNVYYYDEDAGEWKKEDTNRSLDTANCRIQVDVDHMTIFAVLAAHPELIAALAGGGCFIATACYDSPMAEEVMSLCRFRDEYLLRNKLGRKFISAYCRLSPPIADYIRDRETLKRIARIVLKPVVKAVKFIVK